MENWWFDVIDDNKKITQKYKINKLNGKTSGSHEEKEKEEKEKKNSSNQKQVMCSYNVMIGWNRSAVTLRL